MRNPFKAFHFFLKGIWNIHGSAITPKFGIITPGRMVVKNQEVFDAVVLQGHQAIEFPLPDEQGRRKLVALYSCGVAVPEAVVEVIVRKTKKASAAFIKELMRRATQYQLQSGGNDELTLESVESALDEMLFSGGSLNVKLLGGAVEE